MFNPIKAGGRLAPPPVVFFFTHRVGYRAVKKSKIAHNIFITKATDLKLYFWKALENGWSNKCHTLIFVLNKKQILTFFWPFFWHFFNPSTQTKKVIDLNVFQWAGLEIFGYKDAFQPYTYSLMPFSREGRAWDAPQSIHRFRPPCLYRVKGGIKLVGFK